MKRIKSLIGMATGLVTLLLLSACASTGTGSSAKLTKLKNLALVSEIDDSEFFSRSNEDAYFNHAKTFTKKQSAQEKPLYFAQQMADHSLAQTTALNITPSEMDSVERSLVAWNNVNNSQRQPAADDDLSSQILRSADGLAVMKIRYRLLGASRSATRGPASIVAVAELQIYNQQGEVVYSDQNHFRSHTSLEMHDRNVFFDKKAKEAIREVTTLVSDQFKQNLEAKLAKN